MLEERKSPNDLMILNDLEL